MKRPTLSPTNAATVQMALRAVAESDKRMNRYTPQQRAKLKAYARARVRSKS